MCLLTISSQASSEGLRVVNQHNEPVENAVVAIPITTQPSDEPLPVAIMDQVDKQFLPHVLIIQKGQQVSFPNSDDIRHHVYSFSSVKPFEIRLYKGSAGPPILFDKAGIGVLGCNIHDNMVGYIYVAEGEQAQSTNANGEVSFSEPLPETVAVWHKLMSSTASKKVTAPVQIVDGQKQVVIEIDLPSEDSNERTFKSRKFGQGH